MLALLLVLGIFLLVAAIVFFALRYASQPVVAMSPGPATTAADDLLAVVARRYANGEIPREEYLRIRTDLGGPAPAEAETPAPE